MDIIIRHSVLFPTRSLRAENVATMILTFYVPNARTLFHRYWFSSDASRRLQRYFEIIEREIEFPERRAKAISLLRKKKKGEREKKKKQGRRERLRRTVSVEKLRGGFIEAAPPREFPIAGLSTRRFFPRRLEISPFPKSNAG